MARPRKNVGSDVNDSAKNCDIDSVVADFDEKMEKGVGILVKKEKAHAPDNKMSSDVRKKKLDDVFAEIKKKHGNGSVMVLGDANLPKVSVIPTGALSLDIATGIGGFPRGRITEIYGPESSGKTTLTLHAIANSQKQGGAVGFIDAEHAFDPNYASKIGVNVDELILSQPDYGEQALDIAETLIKSDSIDIIIIDSVSALIPKAELDGDMEKNHVGLQARMMSQAMRKLTGALSKTNTALIFINQIRMKIGVMFGNPETTTGGNALKFYSSLRLDIRKISTIKDGDVPVANRARVKVVKNKLAPPFKQAEFDITFGNGISLSGDVLDLATNLGIIEKSGAWYSYNGERVGQGRENSKIFLEEHEDIFEEISEKTRMGCGL